MNDSRGIVPTRPDDLDELGRFLARGFGLPPGAGPVAPGVLLWKYFDPPEEGPRSVLVRDGGRIVGHLGIVPGVLRTTGEPPREASTLHMVDWLAGGGEENRELGSRLMRHVHRAADAPYVLGGTEAARRVFARSGYDLLAEVPVFRRVLRPGHHLRQRGVRPDRGVLRSARDLARSIRRRDRPPAARIALEPVEAFGSEVEDMLAAARTRVLMSRRDPAWLNHLLRYPGGAQPGGWRLRRDGRDVGFALLGVASREGVRAGKIIECFLVDDDPDAWHAAFRALLDVLRDRGADAVECLGNLPWAAEGLRRAGFLEAFRVDLRLHDPSGLVPRDVPFHAAWIEGDYAYL